MSIEKEYSSDYNEIMSHRYDNGFDYWTTSDKRLIKGSPFSMFESIFYLLDIGMEPDEPILKECAEIIFSTWREDGRFKITPEGAIYPCHTAKAAEILCYLGYVHDDRIKRTFLHLLDTQYTDGGWRCNKFSFGRGPETEYSNPFPTLTVLNAFRFTDYFDKKTNLDSAVDFLLDHWTIRKPIGPCHYGIGKLFMQVEYPFRNYNLFVYVYVLSFYIKAKQDKRFLEALKILESKIRDGKIVVERISPKLANLNFCKKNQASELATKRFYEIQNNINR